VRSRRLTAADLDLYRRRLYHGDDLGDLACRLLVAEVGALWAELAKARTDFAAKAAAGLEKRLESVAAYNHGGCPKCRDAEARAFLAKLKQIAGSKPAGD